MWILVTRPLVGEYMDWVLTPIIEQELRFPIILRSVIHWYITIMHITEMIGQWLQLCWGGSCELPCFFYGPCLTSWRCHSADFSCSRRVSLRQRSVLVEHQSCWPFSHRHSENFGNPDLARAGMKDWRQTWNRVQSQISWRNLLKWRKLNTVSCS